MCLNIYLNRMKCSMLKRFSKLLYYYYSWYNKVKKMCLKFMLKNYFRHRYIEYLIYQHFTKCKCIIILKRQILGKKVFAQQCMQIILGIFILVENFSSFTFLKESRSRFCWFLIFLFREIVWISSTYRSRIFCKVKIFVY